MRTQGREGLQAAAEEVVAGLRLRASGAPPAEAAELRVTAARLEDVVRALAGVRGGEPALLGSTVLAAVINAAERLERDDQDDQGGGV